MRKRYISVHGQVPLRRLLEKYSVAFVKKFQDPHPTTATPPTLY